MEVSHDLLAGKAVFITGASRGIGAAAARLFAREGAAVVLAARNIDALDRIVAEVRADGGVADAVKSIYRNGPWFLSRTDGSLTRRLAVAPEREWYAPSR